MEHVSIDSGLMLFETRSEEIDGAGPEIRCGLPFKPKSGVCDFLAPLLADNRFLSVLPLSSPLLLFGGLP